LFAGLISDAIGTACLTVFEFIIEELFDCLIGFGIDSARLYDNASVDVF
jgi:hypothetical protein